MENDLNEKSSAVTTIRILLTVIFAGLVGVFIRDAIHFPNDTATSLRVIMAVGLSLAWSVSVFLPTLIEEMISVRVITHKKDDDDESKPGDDHLF